MAAAAAPPPQQQHQQKVLIDWEDGDLGFVIDPTYKSIKTFANPNCVKIIEYITRDNYYPQVTIEDLLILYKIKPNCVPCVVPTMQELYLGEVETDDNGKQTVYLLNPIEHHRRATDDIEVKWYFDQYVFKLRKQYFGEEDNTIYCYKLNEEYALIGEVYFGEEEEEFFEYDEDYYEGINYGPDNDPNHLFIPNPFNEMQVEGGIIKLNKDALRERLRRPPDVNANIAFDIVAAEIEEAEDEEEGLINEARVAEMIANGQGRERINFYPFIY